MNFWKAIIGKITGKKSRQQPQEEAGPRNIFGSGGLYSEQQANQPQAQGYQTRAPVQFSYQPQMGGGLYSEEDERRRRGGY